MDFDEQTTYPERYHHQGLAMDPMAGLEDGEDFVVLDSGVSVVSSEWRNVSSSGSSSVEDDLTAKDIVNWREFWEIWSSHHPVVMADIRDITLDYPFYQDVCSVVQLAYNIPRSRFNTNSAEQVQVSPELQNFLAQVTQIDPKLLSQDTSLHPQLSTGNGLAIAEVALEVHNAALHLTQEGIDIPDDDWTTQIHDILVVKCARGHLLRSSEAWSMQPQEQSYPESDLSPTAAKILSVRKFHPHGFIPVFLEDGPIAADQVLPINLGVAMFFAAAFSTRSQITSQLRDTPEPVALHSFSVMATSTILTQMNKYGINLPVFGVMFDRNVVRFHVDWSTTAHQKHISVPLTQIDHLGSWLSPFRDFDLTVPDNSLKVVFLLDAIHAYAQCRFTPAVRQRVSYPTPHHPKGFSFTQDEISSEEKVQAWMQSGAAEESNHV